MRPANQRPVAREPEAARSPRIRPVQGTLRATGCNMDRNVNATAECEKVPAPPIRLLADRAIKLRGATECVFKAERNLSSDWWI